MNWISIGKLAVRYLSTATVGTVVMNVVRTTIPKNATTMARTSAIVGGIILSEMVGAKAADYVEQELSVIFGQEDEEENEDKNTSNSSEWPVSSEDVAHVFINEKSKENTDGGSKATK